MAMSDYSLSDIAAAADGAGNGFGDNGSGWWIILLFILLGGWGGNRGWGGNGGGAGTVGGNELYPWMEMQQSINSGFSGLSGQLCNSTNSINQTITGAQIANLQQGFGLSQQLSDCCCENRLATANQTATILAENCADRQAISDGVRDILANNNANTQRIVDWLVEDRLDEKNDEIAQLRNQLNFANLSASQIAQDGRIIDGVYRRLMDCPVPTEPVYGRQPIFTCNNNGCGCGCGQF